MKKLEEGYINKLFGSCFFDDSEIIDGRPISKFISIKSINTEKNMTIVFSTNKLNKNKKAIIEIIDCLPDIDKGNNLENLYYDKNNNKWCKDIMTLDQLIMMGIACDVISYTTIESNNEKTIIIKRTKENDELEVKGRNPELLPKTKNNELSRGYTEEEKQLIAENKIKITNELNNYNEIINIGLGFFGIHAELNNDIENTMDFYDNENNLLLSKNFEDTDGIVGWDAIFNQRLRTEFKDTFCNRITYLVDGNRHIFLLSGPEEQKYGYRVEITKTDNNTYSKIEIRTTDAFADYVIKSIEISDSDLIVELNNQFGPYGNYEDGEKRYLWYKNSKISGKNLLFMTEDEWYDKGHNLTGDSKDIQIDGKVVINGLDNEQFYILSTQIASHPRNKELILYTLDEINKQLPGIKEFVINNFPLYNFIVNHEYQSNSITDAIVDATIHEKCNLKGTGLSKI